MTRGLQLCNLGGKKNPPSPINAEIPAPPNGDAGTCFSLRLFQLETDGNTGVTIEPRRGLDSAAKDSGVILLVSQIGDSSEQTAVLGQVILS